MRVAGCRCGLSMEDELGGFVELASIVRDRGTPQISHLTSPCT